MISPEINLNSKHCEDIQEKAPIHAVIFDLDGTLLDTETLSTEALEYAIQELSGQSITVTWDMKSKLLGLRGPEWSRILLADLNLLSLISPEDMVDRWQQRLNFLCKDVKLMPGAGYLVETLKNMGVLLAIATSSNSASVSEKKKKHPKLFESVNIVVCGDDDELFKGKPDPDIYLLAAKRLGVSPRYCLAFEDAIAGVQAARRAGIACVACPDYRLDRRQFLVETPYVIDTLVDFKMDLWNFECICDKGIN